MRRPKVTLVPLRNGGAAWVESDGRAYKVRQGVRIRDEAVLEEIDEWKRRNEARTSGISRGSLIDTSGRTGLIL